MIKGLGELEVITLFVIDLASSRAFYTCVFEGEVVYEDDVSSVLQLCNVMINLLQRSEAGELVQPLPLADPDTGSQMLLTIKVENVDAVCADLKTHGVELLNGPIDQPWGRRTAVFADPDGNVWEVAQEIT